MTDTVQQEAEQAAIDAWQRGSADTTQMLMAVRAALRVVFKWVGENATADLANEPGVRAEVKLTGAGHYREASALLAEAARMGAEVLGTEMPADRALAFASMQASFHRAAQIHATLAQTAAQVMIAEYHLGEDRNGEPRDLPHDWHEVLYP